MSFEGEGFECIILDLDHTLIHCIKPRFDSVNKHIISIELSNSEVFNLYLRNHLAEFLDFCFENFKNVILWTAATDIYVETILPYLPFPFGKTFHKIITRDLYDSKIKNLDFLLGCDFKIEQTLFVDDIPERVTNLPKDNMIVAPKFHSQCTEKDNYLSDLQEMISIMNKNRCSLNNNNGR